MLTLLPLQMKEFDLGLLKVGIIIFVYVIKKLEYVLEIREMRVMTGEGFYQVKPSYF